MSLPSASVIYKFTAGVIDTDWQLTAVVVDTDSRFTTGAITINVNLGKNVTTRHQCHLHGATLLSKTQKLRLRNYQEPRQR
jgi:hypothetical protein